MNAQLTVRRSTAVAITLTWLQSKLHWNRQDDRLLRLWRHGISGITAAFLRGRVVVSTTAAASIIALISLIRVDVIGATRLGGLQVVDGCLLGQCLAAND